MVHTKIVLILLSCHCMTQAQEFDIKTVSQSGQISLGKAFAGKRVMLEHLEDGRWVITPVAIVPEHLLWTLEPEVTKRLDEYLNWTQSNLPRETDLQTLEQPAPKAAKKR
jgi:hypothetical protein